MLRSDQELAVLKECEPEGVKQLISELNTYSTNLIPEMSNPEINEALLAEQSSIEKIDMPSVEDEEIKI